MEFELIAGNLALDFANTVHSHGLPDPEDDLKTSADLAEWGVQAGLWDDRTSRSFAHLTAAAQSEKLQRARRLREIVYALFVAIANGGPVPARILVAFNETLHDALRHAVVQQADGKYNLVCGHDADPLERLEFQITQSALQLLTSGPLNRIRQCNDETCSWLFLDTSKNGKRQWCEMKTCGNRAKVRRFRERVMEA